MAAEAAADSPPVNDRRDPFNEPYDGRRCWGPALPPDEDADCGGGGGTGNITSS